MANIYLWFSNQIVDDFLKALSWKEDCQCRLCLVEIVPIVLAVVRFYSGNLESARIFLIEQGYYPFYR